MRKRVKFPRTVVQTSNIANWITRAKLKTKQLIWLHDITNNQFINERHSSIMPLFNLMESTCPWQFLSKIPGTQGLKAEIITPISVATLLYSLFFAKLGILKLCIELRFTLSPLKEGLSHFTELQTACYTEHYGHLEGKPFKS